MNNLSQLLAAIKRIWDGSRTEKNTSKSFLSLAGILSLTIREPKISHITQTHDPNSTPNILRSSLLAPRFSLSAFRFSLPGLLLLLFGLFIVSMPVTAQAAPPAQEPDTAPSVSAGGAQWAENCQPCHGPTGQGDGPSASGLPNPPPNLSDPELGRQSVPADNFDVIKNGRIQNLMPPWGNRLSDAEIWNAAAYVWSLSTTPQDIMAGETRYLEQCAACHGEDGSGNGPDAPAEINDFTDLQVMTRQSQAELKANFLAAAEPHAAFSDLTEAEIWQTLDYIRTFTFKVPQRNGILSGQVINATTNEPVGDVEVTLHIFQGNTEIETLTAQADSEGNYRFEKLPTEHSNLYLTEAVYQDVTYRSSEPGVFAPDSNETSLDVPVYEQTTDASAINVSQMHYLVAFSPGQINAVEIFVVGNGGDETYVGQNGQTFTFSLPDGATDVAFQNDPDGTRFIQTDSGYVDTEPIVPGLEGLSIVSSYNIPYNADSLTLDIPIPDDVASLNVLVQEMGASVNSDQLNFVETREVQGDLFSILGGSNLSAGETLTLELTDLDKLTFSGAPNVPAATVATGLVDQNLLRWIVLGLVAVVLVAAVVIYPQMRPSLTHQSGIHHDDPAVHRQKLLLTLARLDQVFEAGELDEEVYRRARSKYKAELAELIQGYK